MQSSRKSSVQTAKKDIMETAEAQGSFTTFAKAVGAADLGATLKGAGPFTVFAPTDEAFAKLPPADLEALLGDKTKLKDMLLHHVLTGKVTSMDVNRMKEGDKVPTVGGRDFVFGRKDGQITVDMARLTKFDIAASNGVIHVIDSVMTAGS